MINYFSTNVIKKMYLLKLLFLKKKNHLELCTLHSFAYWYFFNLGYKHVHV